MVRLYTLAAPSQGTWLCSWASPTAMRRDPKPEILSTFCPVCAQHCRPLSQRPACLSQPKQALSHTTAAEDAWPSHHTLSAIPASPPSSCPPQISWSGSYLKFPELPTVHFHHWASLLMPDLSLVPEHTVQP